VVQAADIGRGKEIQDMGKTAETLTTLSDRLLGALYVSSGELPVVKYRCPATAATP